MNRDSVERPITGMFCAEPALGCEMEFNASLYRGFHANRRLKSIAGPVDDFHRVMQKSHAIPPRRPFGLLKWG
jgi:hypothetical protein